MILLIDDDPSITASLALLLKQAGYSSRSAASPAEALRVIERERFDLVLQDMNFSRQTAGEEGLTLLKAIKAHTPHIPVILITAWGSIPLAVKGIQSGAADFVTKPWSNPQLLQSVRTALSLTAASSIHQETPTREELDAHHDFRHLIGRDPRWLKILHLVGRVSPTDAPVLVTGESGTGKEEVAEALHRNSPRKDAPFVKVNLGGISSTLFESEMFGHVKGAFTDARQDRKGRFEVADGGTIFLDEIGDLDPACQVKLLRVLQDRTYEPLGSSAPRTVDIRVISATNRDLPERVEKGDFREDLLYRLNLIAVHLPPLRERSNDIPLLAEHFLQVIGSVYRRNSLSISDAALRWLGGLSWPGNVRQLKQVIERTILMTSGDILEAEDFERALSTQSDEGRRDLLPAVGSMTMDELEKAMILKCLDHHQGNISRVAEALDLSRAALYRRFEKYGIQS
ncbi:MAG: sigma-54-dependent Fis family transcriptional regulator [Candidatus Latescibacteria bacterium]|nr:sigma-54-dependent Fis family transcriptional regulator [Candidatus Latescibacterota bacterium]